MSTFDEREKAFENKYKHDQELQFRVEVRRNKLLGLWVGEMLGKSGQEAEDYAKEVISSDFEEPGEEDVVRKVMHDIEKAGVEFSEHRLRKKMAELVDVAKDQIMKE